MPTPPRVEPSDRRMACGCTSLADYRWLFALAVGLPLLEAVLLGAVGPEGSAALAPQTSAPAPFGVFHDLRWVLVFHPSWLAFGLEMVALIVVRSTITALLVRAAWPRGTPAPSPRQLASGSIAFTVACTVVLAPFAALLLGMAVVSLSWLFFIAIPAVVTIAALVHHGVVMPAWWRERPPGRTVAWMLSSFIVLTMASACIVLAPAPLRLPAVAAAGLFNAWAWHSIVHTLCCRERSPRFIPIAPVGVAALLGLIAVGVSTGFSVAARDGGPVPTTTTPATDADPVFGGRAVLLVSGFGSSYSADGDDSGMWTTERRYSYAGSAGGRPLRYEATDTYQDVSISVERMAAQVEAFHADVDAPITIIAESEGALVAKAYLLSHPEARVDTLVLLSPLVEPGAAYYPPAGDDGWGAAAGLGLRWIAAFANTLSPLEVTSDDGLFRSLADNAPALRGMLACPVDGVDQLAVFPLADAVAGAEPELDGVESTVVPAFHGGLATNGDVQRTIHAALERGVSPDGDDWLQTTDRVIRAGTAAWRVPTLPISVNPAWEEGDDAAGCADIAELVEAWVG